MSRRETQKECSCTQNLKDLLRAAPPKNDPLRKVTCEGCGIVFWTNSDNNSCFNCQAKKRDANM